MEASEWRDNSDGSLQSGLASGDIEIGGARDDELDAVLRVMCAAFELPFEVARPIYYADPWFDAQNKRVLRVGGRIVSCLTVVPVRVYIGTVEMPVFGIAGVATLPEMQRLGYAGRLLTDTIHWLERKGVPVAGLFPFERTYYRRFGWETASTVCRCLVSPHILPAYRERQAVRPAHEADLPQLQSLYASWRDGTDRTLWALRDSTRWRYLFERVPNMHVFVGFTGALEGYLLSELQPGEISLGLEPPGGVRPPRLRILELCAMTEASRRGLIGHLATQTPCEGIVYERSVLDIAASGLLVPEWQNVNTDRQEIGVRLELAPGVMLRVVNFFELILTLRQGWRGFTGTIILTVRDTCRSDIVSNIDSNIARRESSVTVSGNGEGLPAVVITERHGDGTTNSGRDELSQVTGGVHVWARVVVGHVAGDAACSLGALEATGASAARLCGELFPQRAAFLPLPDHF